MSEREREGDRENFESQEEDYEKERERERERERTWMSRCNPHLWRAREEKGRMAVGVMEKRGVQRGREGTRGEDERGVSVGGLVIHRPPTR